MIKVNPKKSVNDMLFGDQIENYLSKFAFNVILSADATNWDLYELESIGLEIYVERGNIVSIACRKTLTYNGIELIGITISDLEEKIKNKHNEKDQIYLAEEEIAHDVYEFENFGFQVWVKNNKIDCIFCTD